MLREGAYDIAVGALLLSYVSAALLWSVVFGNTPILGDMERGLWDSDRGFGSVGENVLMKAIKCRACGEEHWGLCAGAGDFIVNKVVNSPILGVGEKVAPLILLDKCSDSRHLYKEESRGSSTVEHLPCKQVVSGSIPGSGSKHGKYADKEKRRAYQREYMRKRRANGNG